MGLRLESKVVLRMEDDSGRCGASESEQNHFATSEAIDDMNTLIA